jgi:hypothetical protein
MMNDFTSIEAIKERRNKMECRDVSPSDTDPENGKK